MVTRDDDKFVIWPIYLDRTASRPPRRVAREVAVRDPRAEEIAKVAQALRLSPVLEKGKSHPARPLDGRGRVLVDVRGSKAVLLRQIAEKLKAQRSS